jgi:hypothetical protein
VMHKDVSRESGHESTRCAPLLFAQSERRALPRKRPKSGTRRALCSRLCSSREARVTRFRGSNPNWGHIGRQGRAAALRAKEQSRARAERSAPFMGKRASARTGAGLPVFVHSGRRCGVCRHARSRHAIAAAIRAATAVGADAAGSRVALT